MKITKDYLNEIAHKTDIFYEITEDKSKQLKTTLLEMYKDLSALCQQNDIKLMLSNGTCIGAVRHQGFIPWDDDLDVILLREDYDRLASVFDNCLSDRYYLVGPNRPIPSGLYMRMYKKGTIYKTIYNHKDEACQGIYIDIYPVEKMPDNKIVRTLKCFYLDFLRMGISSIAFSSKNRLLKKAFELNFRTRCVYYIRKIIGSAFSLMGSERMSRYYDRAASSSNGHLFRSVPTGSNMARKECHPSEVFFPPRNAMFEGLDVFIPNDVDKYLSALYGDYMKVPPPEKRERHFYLELDFGDNKILKRN